MKTKTILFLIVITLQINVNVFGQKTEWRCSLNSGLFFFGGMRSTGTTAITSFYQTKTGFTDNPFGDKSGDSYGFSFNFKRLSKADHFWGMDLGFERLQSKESIDRVYEFVGTPEYATLSNTYSATGQVFLTNSFLTLNPFVGHRYRLKQVNFDLTAGLDMAYCLSAVEKGNATAIDGTNYTTSGDRKNINWDFRPRIQLQVGYKRIGLYFGYSGGLTDYLHLPGSVWVKSKFVRAGVSFKL